MILQRLTTRRVHRKHRLFRGQCIEWHFWRDDQVVPFRAFPNHDISMLFFRNHFLSFLFPFFLFKGQSKIGVGIKLGCALSTGKYGNDDVCNIALVSKSMLVIFIVEETLTLFHQNQEQQETLLKTNAGFWNLNKRHWSNLSLPNQRTGTYKIQTNCGCVKCPWIYQTQGEKKKTKKQIK